MKSTKQQNKQTPRDRSTSPVEEPAVVDYSGLNVAGRAVMAAGFLADIAAGLIDQALERTADIVVATGRAFREGRDATVEDATILHEEEIPRKSR